MQSRCSKKKDLASIIVDTTVQIKNIKYPHDVYLMDKARIGFCRIYKSYYIKIVKTKVLDIMMPLT
ncbi:hypothetical protein [Candidatus Tisiphia endosymbiont of Parasteatoda lunata]|uniref:hypothetical protein n=1 Tax=Candidatus Tisiphia endosymbiont of Parasteatoda lunata TaxID=3066275 RepID=UPI00313DF7EE